MSSDGTSARATPRSTSISGVYGGAPERSADTAENEESVPKARERFVILSIQRGEKVMPMHAGLSLEVGDVAAVAVHREEREGAAEVLAAWGWTPNEPLTPPDEDADSDAPSV